MAQVRQGFIAEGTVCKSCEQIVISQARKVKGVSAASFSIKDEQGYVTFDDRITDIDEILDSIEEKGYSCFILDESDAAAGQNASEQQKQAKAHYDQANAGRGISEKHRNIGFIMLVAGILIAAYFLLGFMEGINMPQISAGMGIGLIFVIGLLTGFHCISMCGGFVLSYCTDKKSDSKTSSQMQAGKDDSAAPAVKDTPDYLKHGQYAAGKIISYTVIGAAFGLLGSIVAFTPMMRGIAGILAGIFLLVFGIRMLGIFPSLRRFHISTPKFLQSAAGKQKKPLVIGLLNGLMIACGPLQAIYVMAAGTGSMAQGALMLFVFALGTLPVMLGFGFFATMISARLSSKIMKASGVIVLILGLMMLNNGLALTGTGYDANSLREQVSASFKGSGTDVYAAPGTRGGNDAPSDTGSGSYQISADGYQEIRMAVTSRGWEPDRFVLKKDVPVRWIIDGQQINGCNNAIQVPKLGLEFPIKKGEQIIEFTPTEDGVISWSCWMGMIPGTFIVKEDIDLSDSAAVRQELSGVPVQKSAGSCGCGG